MNNYPFADRYYVQEVFDRATRAAERQQLIRMAEAHKAALRGRRGRSPVRTELWASLLGRFERRVGSARVKVREVLAGLAKPAEPQDQCC